MVQLKLYMKKVSQLENFFGFPLSDDVASITIQVDHISNKVGKLTQILYEFMVEMKWKHVQIMANITTLTDTLKVRVQKLEDKMVVTRSATHSPSTSSVEIVPSKIRASNLKLFNGSKNAKELKIFL